MSLSLVFWILMLVWLVFGAYSTWPCKDLKASGGTLLLFILLLVLGWKVFGPPIHQ